MMTRQRTTRARLAIEPLEDRRLLAGQILLDSANWFVEIIGTSGPDYARVTLDDGAVVVNLAADGADSSTHQASFDPSQVRGILFHGSEGDDRFLNDSGYPALAFGGGGDDYLEGHGSVDRLYGDAGDDVLVGFGDNDSLRGGPGNDYLFGVDGDDRLFGDRGRDRLYGGAGSDRLNRDKGDLRDGSSNGPLVQVAASQSQKLASQLGLSSVSDLDLSALESAIIDLTNHERQRAGLAPVQISLQLVDAARHHAHNMARFGRLAHTLDGADLPTLHSRLTHYGYRYLNAGENIAYNFSSAASVVNAWMGSAGHRANMLNPDFTEIGVGVVSVGGQPYICQVFGRSL